MKGQAGSVPASGAPASRRPRPAYGRGYSRFVSLAKRILPAVALGLLLLIFAWPRLEAVLENFRMRFPRLDLSEARELRMVNAHYSGLDRENRPFTVTADTARQTDNEDLVSLEVPKADMATDNGHSVKLSADTGLYQQQPQLLDLFGDVILYQDRGNEFHSASARIDMAAGSAEGHEPVTGRGPFGRVAAQGFRVLNRGDVVIFTGKTHLDLNPRQRDTP